MDIPKRKLPIKRKWLALTDEWEGWNFEARMNAPIKAFGLVSSGEFEKIIEGLSLIVLDWDFVDTEG